MNFMKRKLASIDNRGSREGSATQDGNGFSELDRYVPTEIRILRDLQSKFSEEEILEFLTASRPDLAESLREELDHGRTRDRSHLDKAIGQMMRKNAISGLNGMHRLHRLAAGGELAVAWPVPPHVADEICAEMDEELYFAAEDHLPPHLGDMNIRYLDAMLPDEVEAAFSSVKGILADGRIRAGHVTTRRSIVRVLQVLRGRNVVLFLHNIPHPPPHAEFAEVSADTEVVEIR